MRKAPPSPTAAVALRNSNDSEGVRVRPSARQTATLPGSSHAGATMENTPGTGRAVTGSVRSWRTQCSDGAWRRWALEQTRRILAPPAVKSHEGDSSSSAGCEGEGEAEGKDCGGRKVDGEDGKGGDMGGGYAESSPAGLSGGLNIIGSA